MRRGVAALTDLSDYLGRANVLAVFQRMIRIFRTARTAGGHAITPHLRHRKPRM